MDQAVTVALVRGDNRRGAVAQVLSLLVAEVARCVSPGVLIMPCLAGPGERALSTHSETLSATLDAVLAAGANDVTVAAGAPDASAMFETLGYTREVWGRPVSFLDIDRGESRWDTVGWTGPDGSRRSARVARTVADAPCRVALATTTAAGFSHLRSVLGSLHPDDRGPLLPPMESDGDFLVALARTVGPHLFLVDAFQKGRRGGGRQGRSRAVGTVIAGLDAVAVGAVAAAVRGSGPREVEPGARAQAAGLGVADLDAITLLGDPIVPAQHRRAPRPHGVSLPRRARRSEAGLSAPDAPRLPADISPRSS